VQICRGVKNADATGDALNHNPTNPKHPHISIIPGMLNYAGDAGDLVIDTAAAG